MLVYRHAVKINMNNAAGLTGHWCSVKVMETIHMFVSTCQFQSFQSLSSNFRVYMDLLAQFIIIFPTLSRLFNAKSKELEQN